NTKQPVLQDTKFIHTCQKQFEAYTPWEQPYLHIGLRLRVCEHYRATKVTFWLELMPHLHGTATAAPATEPARPAKPQPVMRRPAVMAAVVGHRGHAHGSRCVTIAVGASLLFLNVLAFTVLYYKKDKRRHEAHHWQHMQRAVHMQHGVRDATVAGGIRMACPPNFALTLRNAPDDIPRVTPSIVTMMGAAIGGSSGALHAFNDFAGGCGGGNGQNLPHKHSTTQV
ncbi:hypothetical protein U0070_018090, partial [Myodes glareolus]